MAYGNQSSRGAIGFKVMMSNFVYLTLICSLSVE